LFRSLVAFERTSQLPDGFIDAVPKLEYAFAPPEKKRFVLPPAIETLPSPEVSFPDLTSFSVTFLGTGAMCPAKYRNVAGILLRTRAGFVLLDAGEGTTGQIRRKFGPDNCNYILQNLLCVWISHVHGDHHFGLYQLLQTRAGLCEVPIPLICNDAIANYMTVLQENSGFGSLRFVHYTFKDVLAQGHLTITSIPVAHCPGSHGCVCDIDGGFRIAYSGDRCPKDSFAKAVGRCDLLIHEATFTDDLAVSAAAKHHSTIGQALQTGRDCGAKYLVLTHFSQRYPKLPVFGADDANVAFAVDYLSFSFEDLPELCQVCPRIFDMIVELEESDEPPSDGSSAL
jgi:ribonuclease Z